MVARDGVGAERARPLAGRRRRVDPALVEEAAADAGQLGRERVVGVEHQLRGVGPAERAVLGGHRAAPVVVGQAVEAEQAGLDPVPALGQVVAALHGVDQRGDRGVAGLVDQVPRGQPVVVVAQAVVGGLLEEDGVQDEGPGAQAGRQPFGDRLGRGLADRAVRVGEEREAVLEARRSPSSVTSMAASCSSNSRCHAAIAGQVLLGRDPLLGLGQEVGPAEAGDAQVVADGIEARVGQERLGPLVVEGGPLELEEQQLGADRGGPLLDLGDQRAAATGRRCRWRSAGRRSCRPGSGPPRGAARPSMNAASPAASSSATWPLVSASAAALASAWSSRRSTPATPSPPTSGSRSQWT